MRPVELPGAANRVHALDLAQYSLEMVAEDGAFVMCRGHRTAPGPTPDSVLVVMTRDEQPPPAQVRMLEHEYGLRNELDDRWAVRPMALAAHDRRACLVLNDPGGELLARTAGSTPMALTPFLRLAAGLAAALAALHRRGIIHKDVTPAHVITDQGTGQVWLTGFRIASRVGRERPNPRPPEMIAGTLPYMAPEQTGRMNRSIDPRSDLYSLGVTLYHVLTGTLPFTASDPSEWVHCHVARQPLPPIERVPDVPPVVSAILMRLLTKTPEGRYQTAGGLERDLRRCLTQWEATREIDAFPLGEGDIPDRLVIPERLYGRDRELEILRSAFDRVVTNGRPELILVSGHSGIGKSSVVHELHRAVVRARGLFASGKFDQSRRGVPYATLAQALQGLVRGLLAKPERELRGWRAALTEALDGHGHLAADLVPELELILGPQPPAATLPVHEAQVRFHLVLQRVLAVFAAPEHPLVLFLDDLQWLDGATLDLLDHLMIRADLRYLLVVGAYRSNEVGANHPLRRTIQAVRQAGGAIHEVPLPPLAPPDVADFIADALHGDVTTVAPLAHVVTEKTGGNPFFITRFLTAVADGGLLAFDHARACWVWHLAGVRSMRCTENVAELMLDRLSHLPAPTQLALRTLSCLGDRAAVETLSLVLGCSIEQVHTDLRAAVALDMVDDQNGTYHFLHDRVQEAAYALLPEEQRSGEHRRIGHLLRAGTPAATQEQMIFEIVNQLNRGSAVIASSPEREQLAELNLMAGRRATVTAAYGTALQYFVSGAALLPRDAWEACPALAFALAFGRAECEFVTGDLAAAEKRLSMLAAHAPAGTDAAVVVSLRVALYAVLRRFDRAVEIALECLKTLGIEWSPHPTDDEVRHEHERLWRQLGTRSIESLFELPLMSDPLIRQTVEVLSEFQGPAHYTDQNLEHLLLLRIANLSIQHGNSHASTVAYAYLPAVVGARFGRYDAGDRFGRLALALVDRKGLNRARPRVYRTVAAWAMPWVHHLREGRPLLRRGLDAAESWRPLPHYLMWLNASLVANGLACGDPLADVALEAETGRRRVTQRTGPRPSSIDVMTGQLGLIRTLRGSAEPFGSFGEDELDHDRLERCLTGGPELKLAAGWYCMYKLQAHVYAAEHDRAAAMAEQVRPLLWTVTAEFLEAEYHFYGALARAAAADAASPEHRRTLLEAAADSHQKLSEWSSRCPENFTCRAALVAAELARHEQRELEAERLYEAAITSARLHGFVQVDALANELAARFNRARGFETPANAYLQEARYRYRLWGAEGKARQLDRRSPPAPDGRVHESQPTIAEPLDHLDLAAVLEASQALAGEIVPERFVDRLLRTAIEHAGGERALLLLASGEQLTVQAEAIVGDAGLVIRLLEAPISADLLAESVVQYVARTQEPLVLNDATASQTFAGDPYVRRTRARSILCLPLVKQRRVVALLYLENRLTPDVFVEGRTGVLRVVAPQAAMALENSRLYRELERREAKIRRLVEANIIGVVITESGGRIVEANDALLRIVGRPREEVNAGRLEWGALLPAEWQAAKSRAVAQLFATGSFDVLEAELLREDGTRVPVLLAGAVVSDAPHQSVVFVIDITERKRAEQDRERLRQAMADLAHVNRIGMMGELATSLSHELRQPITAAMTDAKTCLRWLNREEPDLLRARNAIGRVLSSGTRAAAIIDHLRTFYRRDAHPQREPVELNGLAGEMVALMSSEARRHGVVLHADLSAHRSTVVADRVQLQQVLMNLVLNAIEAMKDGGGDLIVKSSTARNGQLTISVSDTGKGLPEGLSEEIFAPFFSTKPDGSGMGLPISRSIVEAHGGRLWAADNPGRGATFCFTLPTGGTDDPIAG